MSQYEIIIILECTNIDGIDRKECNYKNCDDGIYTWGE